MKINKITFLLFKINIGLLCIYPTLVVAVAKEKAVITGDRMEILQRGDIVEYKGNVKLVHRDNIITADFMRREEKVNVVTAIGQVKFVTEVDTSTRVEVYSPNSRYEVDKETAEFWTPAKLVRHNLSNVKDKFIMNADIIRFTREQDNGIIYARENVKLTVSQGTGTPVNVEGGNFRYDIDIGTGSVWTDVKLTQQLSSAATDYVKLRSERINIFDKDQKLHAEKKVSLVYQDSTATGEDGWYYSQSGILTLTGEPKLDWRSVKNRAEYTAELVKLILNENRMVLERNVVGRIYSLP